MAQQHTAELQKHLWAIANQLRGNSGLDANEFKNYALGIIFYKFLSEKIEDQVSEYLVNDSLSYAQAWEQEDMREGLKQQLLEEVGYFVEPRFLFSSLIAEIKKGEAGEFDIELLQEALAQITNSTRGEDSEEDFEGLFEGMDLNSSGLGRDVDSRSRFMANILTQINQISFHHDDVETDVLGDAYEYMISNFASEAGKKAGEFYTPQSVSTILASILATGRESLRKVYDPTCGSGSLLLRIAKQVPVSHYYGQELNPTTYNLARMNMMLHGVPYDRFTIRSQNTLTHDLFEGEIFDGIAANPPYSVNWSPADSMLQDPRFADYGKLAPASKADFAFVQHMLHHLEDNGTMAVVLPHGVLFRGAAEGVIRKKIIENNWLDSVIGLPAGIFYGTGIPTAVLVFKKNRKADDSVLIMDASAEFQAGKNQNLLANANIDRIVSTYRLRNEEEGFAHLANLKEIEGNDFNLNISRYVVQEVKNERIDLEQISKELQQLEKEEEQVQVDLAYYLSELNQDSGLVALRDEDMPGLLDTKYKRLQENAYVSTGALYLIYYGLPSFDPSAHKAWAARVAHGGDYLPAGHGMFGWILAENADDASEARNIIRRDLGLHLSPKSFEQSTGRELNIKHSDAWRRSK